MATQAENNGLQQQPHDSVSAHELFSRMLFTDAIKGVGIPSHEVGMLAERGGLAELKGDQYNEIWAWKAEMLEDMSLDALQALYLSLKKHEVTPT